jgi:hypothetical protein
LPSTCLHVTVLVVAAALRGSASVNTNTATTTGLLAHRALTHHGLHRRHCSHRHLHRAYRVNVLMRVISRLPLLQRRGRHAINYSASSIYCTTS